MSNLLLEIGLEEVPARFMLEFLDNLGRLAENKLETARLSYKSLQTLGTYRRLVLHIEGLIPKQEDISEEVKGPPKVAAYKDGKPTKAAEGFAKSQGIKVSDLKIKNVEGKEYVVAKVFRAGQPTSKILTTLLPEIITSLYLPLSMRWGKGDFRFIRPLHWLLSLYGDKVVKFTLAGIASGNKTYGHRFLSPKASKIEKADLGKYKTLLKAKGVILDQAERKAMIRRAVEDFAHQDGGEPIMDEDLLNENTFLAENPVCLTGRVETKYLSLPRDVLITPMKKHQKYFPVVDKDDKPLSTFIIVADGANKKALKLIKEGNERVLRARLEDAKFYFEEDRKTPFISRVENLKKIAFQEGLGSIHDKVERIKKLSLWLAGRLQLKPEQKKIVEDIAKLCKADLTTQMVGEFTELQGVIGREYLLLENGDQKVARGIFEHYLPRHTEDKLPSFAEAMVVSVADKIDSIVGSFAQGVIPTGSEDPYGLRRAAHGIVSIVIERKINLPLGALIKESFSLYKNVLKKNVNYQDLEGKVLEFIAARIKGILLEEKVRYDVADAALGAFVDIYVAYEKAKLMHKEVGKEWFADVVTTADRLQRLAKTAKSDQIDENKFTETEEKELFKLFSVVKGEVAEVERGRDYLGAMRELARMTAPVDHFFTKVMVMVKDEGLRDNRLAFLKAMEKMFLSVADFPKIVQ